MDSSEKARADGTVWSAGLAGIAAFIVFSIITQTLMNNAPSATESSQKIFSYLALHQGQLQASAVLAALAAFAVLVWASALFRAEASQPGSGPRDPETSNALLSQPGSRPGSVMTARGALPSRGVSTSAATGNDFPLSAQGGCVGDPPLLV